MSTYCEYQAIPDPSPLLDKLRTNRSFCLMYTTVLLDPSDVFTAMRLSELHEQYVEQSLHLGHTKTPDEARRVLMDFFDELRETLKRSPGLDRRCGSLRLSDELDSLLQKALSAAGHTNPQQLLQQITLGTERFAPESFGDDAANLHWNSAEVVREGWTWLEKLDRKKFANHAEEFEELCRVYREAAIHGEALLYG